MAQKLFADANRASLREIVEDNAAWGLTPAAGKTRARRFTQSSLTVSKETAVSEEIRDDRMVSSVIETAASSGGDINWEFAAGSQDLDFQRVLQGAWSRPIDFDVFRGETVSIEANNQIVIAGDSVADYFTVGRRIKTSGFINAVNNDYFQIAAVVYAGGVTTVTTTTATMVKEPGSGQTVISDANDVLMLKATNLRFGTGGARRIDSNGANAFAAALATKQLVPGQRIFVEGVGYEQGSLTLTNVVDNDEVTISAGDNAYIFEAQADVDVANISAFRYPLGVDNASTAANLAAAINKVRLTGDLAVAAKAVGSTVTLTNLNKEGGFITNASPSIAVVPFAGGNEDLGGFYTLVTVTDDALVVDRDVPTLAAGLPVTIKASMLRNPGRSADIVAQAASIETSFHDVGQNFLMDGLRMGSMELEITAGSIVTGSTTVQGRQTKRSNVAKLDNPANYTVLEAASTESVSATANVGALEVAGAELSTAIMSIKLTIEGNLREQRAVGSKFPEGIAAGRLNITGTISAYFADGSLFDRFLNHETTSLSFPIIDPDDNTYYFTVPAFKIMSDPIAPGGTDQDVMEEMEFTAFRDNITKCMLQIDRFSSVAPITAI
jgi:hypothetical protein